MAVKQIARCALIMSMMQAGSCNGWFKVTPRLSSWCARGRSMISAVWCRAALFGALPLSLGVNYRNKKALSLQFVPASQFSQKELNGLPYAVRESDRNFRHRVLQVEGVNVGACSYSYTPSDRGQILTLGVHKDHRKKGYGSKLLQYALREMDNAGVKEIDLMIPECSENRAALQTYQKVGFVPTDPHVCYLKRKRNT